MFEYNHLHFWLNADKKVPVRGIANVWKDQLYVVIGIPSYAISSCCHELYLAVYWVHVEKVVNSNEINVTL